MFTAELLTEVAKAADIHISHATIKHAQTIGMVERTHAKLKKILKISVNADRPQWDRYVDIAIMAHNTTYHDSLKCSPTDFSRQDTFYRSYIPRLADKFCKLQELIKNDVPFKLSQQHKVAIFEINESLLKATKVSLKLPLPDKQLVIMCDASEHAAGYVLLIEDYAVNFTSDTTRLSRSTPKQARTYVTAGSLLSSHSLDKIERIKQALSFAQRQPLSPLLLKLQR